MGGDVTGGGMAMPIRIVPPIIPWGLLDSTNASRDTMIAGPGRIDPNGRG